ncbi:MAG TPA: discoidin domain-containing protein [Candidatus Acidoferrum sp.]|jgi:hypothetical protein|nr:discoidin domain-containing protein [Candidatus Acidoferrum sp.]
MKKLPTPLVATVILGLFLPSVVSAADCRINLALSSNGSVASQRDDPFGLPPANGNDGNIVNTTAFAHTGNADNEWWEVNLEAAHPIKEVRIWLRSDGVTSAFSRDANLRLVVYDNASHSTELYSQFLDGSAIPLPYRNIDVVLPSLVTGQVVRVEHPVGYSDYLQINEVQVFSEAIEEVNLALAGAASQSSTFSTYPANRANDGVNVGLVGDGVTSSTAHTGGDPLPWWQVDLGSMQPISMIRVFTAADTAQDRNDDLALVIFDNLGGIVSSNYNAVHPSIGTLPGHDFPNNKQYLLYTFNPAITGQVMQVAHTPLSAADPYLVLSEVEVLKAYTNAPSINISQGPTNSIVPVNQSVNLSVAACVAGANANYLSYQWQSNGVDIAGAHAAAYTTPLLTAQGQYTYGVRLLLPGYSVTTQAVITVTSDTTPPIIVSNSFAARSTLKMTLNFNKVLDPVTATNSANYSFSSGPTISALTLEPSGKDVTLTVGGLVTCDQYTLTVSGVKDLTGNTIVTTNLSGTMPSYQLDYALDGTATDSSNPFGYPARNAIDGDTGTFMHTSNGDNEWWEVDLGAARNIGQIALWFRADCSTCVDRDGNLLITVLNDSINRIPVWTNTVVNPVPFTANPRMTNLLVNPPVTGQIVRVEHPPGLGGTDNGYLDFTEVQVIPPSIGFCIVQSPASVSVVTNDPASFHVVAQGAGPFTYQWMHAGTNLPGAANATLFIPTAGVAQAGTYTVQVTSPDRTHTSDPAVLSLVPPAVVNPLLKIEFRGTLGGTSYTLGAGEVDVTGTFAALQGTEVISNGFAILSAAAMGQGFSVTNNIVDKGNRPETNFIIEMVFAPTPGTDQGVGQNNNYADIFSIGSIYYAANNHSDAVFVLGYASPTTYRLGMDALLGTGANSSGSDAPTAGVLNHIALVYILGPGRTNNILRYYLNGNLIVEDVTPDNGASASAGSVYAAFGQAVPGSSFIPRGLDGLLDAVAYSTFSGVFSPHYSFQISAPPTLNIAISGSQLTVSWTGVGYTVQQNTILNNPSGWADVSGATTSPFVTNVGSGTRYYRLRKQ